MKIIYCGLLLVVTYATSANAGRLLIVPSMRLRGDAAGSTTTTSVQYPEGPLNKPLLAFEVRYRFEFTNLDPKYGTTVSVYARPGTLVGARTSRFLYGTYEVGPFIPRTKTLDTRTKLFSLTLGNYDASTTDHSKSGIFLFVCDIPQGRCNADAVYIDAPDTSPQRLSSLPTDWLSVLIDPTQIENSKKDMMLELTGNFDIEVSTDRGAVVGSVAAIANRTGGYYQVLQQSSGNIALNGGRPF